MLVCIGCEREEFVRKDYLLKKNYFYSVQFKLDVLNFMKPTCTSYQDAAIEVNMNNWNINYQSDKGSEFLCLQNLTWKACILLKGHMIP